MYVSDLLRDQSLITLTARQQKLADNAFAACFGLPTLVLMEQAAASTADAIARRFGDTRPLTVLVVAGGGNNGGDGWAIARQLSAYPGYTVTVLDLCPDRELPADSELNRAAYCKYDAAKTQWPDDRYDIIVDAVLGSGFKADRPIGGRYAEILDAMRESREHGTRIVAVDVPSGIEAGTGRADPEAIAVDLTVSYGSLKTGIVAAPGASYAGERVLAPISMPQTWLRGLEDFGDPDFVLDAAALRGILPGLDPLAHKGSRGTAMLIAGSTAMPGALQLATSALLETGIGYAYAMTEREVGEQLLNACPEVLLRTHDDYSAEAGAGVGAKAVAVGPGMGPDHPFFEQHLRDLIRTQPRLVIDADGLNVLAKMTDRFELLREHGETFPETPVVLTPHPGEFKRLLPEAADMVAADRQNAARELARKGGAIVVLKGAGTVVAMPDGSCWINTKAPSELARAGSGDVLTGMITGLAATDIPLGDAVLAGVHLHGLCACALKDDTEHDGFRIADVPKYFSRAAAPFRR